MEPRYAASSELALVRDRTARQARAKASPGQARTRAGDVAIDDGAIWKGLFDGPALSAAECEALDVIAQVRNLSPGESVFSHLSPAHALVALLDGEVALGFRTADGTFRTERIMRGLDWLDLSSSWLDEPHAMDARAISPARVIELPHTALEACIAHHPGLALRLIQGLAREVQALAFNTHELMHKDAPGRLAQWLRQRSKPVLGREGEAVVQLHERKRDVASQLAITPETLSRLMRSFSRQGVIEVAGYTVRVLDTRALARMAQA